MIKITNANHAPSIEIDEEAVERMTGGGKGPTVADVVVKHSDGRHTRFFLTVGVNRQGRAVAEISTNGPRFGSTKRKSVTGHKHE